MDEGTIKTSNPKCRLYWCFIEFLDWRYSQSCWYFRPLLWTVAPLPSLWPPPPLPPSQNKPTVYTDSVWLWGGGVLSCVVDHILQEFNTLFLTRFRTYKIATPPKTKTPVKTTFRDWCLYSSFVHALLYISWWKLEGGASKLWKSEIWTCFCTLPCQSERNGKYKDDLSCTLFHTLWQPTQKSWPLPKVR